MSRCFRAGASALVLALSVACVVPAVRIPLDAARRTMITSTATLAAVPQDEIHATIEASQGGVMFAGLLGAAFDAGANLARMDAALAEVAPLKDALVFYDPRSTVQSVLGAELPKIGLLQGTKLELTRKPAFDKVTLGGVMENAGTDAVLVISFRYELSSDFKHIVVSSTATLLPTKAAASPELKQLAAAPSPNGVLPCQALYRGYFMTSLPAPGGGRWTADLGAAAVTAIDGGIAEVVRMLAWDLEQGAPQDGRYASGAPAAYLQFGVPRPWASVRDVNGRHWLRSSMGELVSVGEMYPAPAGEAKPVRLGRVFRTVQAASYAPSSAQRAAGAVGGVEIINPVVGQIEAARENAKKMRRAFGNDTEGPVDPAAGFVLDRLESGRTSYAPSLEAYVRTALTAELGLMGVTVTAGRPTLRAELVVARAERSHQGFGVTLNVRFDLLDASGKVRYSVTKWISTPAEELADSEVDAFHAALRKAAEALASDPGFVASVR